LLIVDCSLVNPCDDGVYFAIGELGLSIGHSYETRCVCHVAYNITLVDIGFYIVESFQGDPAATGITAGSVAGITILLEDGHDTRGIGHCGGITRLAGGQLVFAFLGASCEGQDKGDERQDNY